jgi:hypothetical protein
MNRNFFGTYLKAAIERLGLREVTRKAQKTKNENPKTMCEFEIDSQHEPQIEVLTQHVNTLLESFSVENQKFYPPFTVLSAHP